MTKELYEQKDNDKKWQMHENASAKQNNCLTLKKVTNDIIGIFESNSAFKE